MIETKRNEEWRRSDQQNHSILPSNFVVPLDRRPSNRGRGRGGLRGWRSCGCGCGSCGCGGFGGGCEGSLACESARCATRSHKTQRRQFIAQLIPVIYYASETIFDFWLEDIV